MSSELWYEITAKVPPADVEAVAAIMGEMCPGGVTIQEPIDILGPEEGYRVREGEAVSLCVYIPVSELGAVVADDLRHALHAFPGVEIIAKPIQQQDWATSWREFFGVVDTGGRVVVVPTWIEHEAAPGQMVIRLDPGQAFGTGHHETTRLCLRALEDAVTPRCSVLDVGTGSGILAIGAGLLGAGPILGIDIDPIATKTALENLDENGMAGRIEIQTGVLAADHGIRYDVVVANINRDANLGLAETFGNVVTPGGTLLLSGILAEDASKVCAAMESNGFALAQMRHERDWCLLGFTRS